MKIKFVPQNKEVEVKPGQSVLNAAQENGISIRSVCKGVPSCAECRVTVVEGMNNILPPGDAELDLIGTAHFVDQRRLACQMRCFGDLVVDLQDHVDKGMGNLKQPRGSIKKEAAESRARMGNVIEEADAPQDIKIEMTDEERKEAEEALKQREQRLQQKQNKKKKSSSNKPKKNARRGNDFSSGAQGNGKKKKSRNRNRKRKPKKNTE